MRVYFISIGRGSQGFAAQLCYAAEVFRVFVREAWRGGGGAVYWRLERPVRGRWLSEKNR